MSSFSLVEVGETESPEVPRVHGAEGCDPPPREESSVTCCLRFIERTWLSGLLYLREQ